MQISCEAKDDMMFVHLDEEDMESVVIFLPRGVNIAVERDEHGTSLSFTQEAGPGANLEVVK
jgi:hypothetical protein